MKFKNVECVSPIDENNELAQINCHDENFKNHESYFLNKNMEIAAHFKSPEPFWAEQLSEKSENLFVLDDISYDNIKHNYKIIRVENDRQDIIYTCQDFESGVEDGCFAVKNDNLWGYINDDGIEIIKPQYADYCSFASNLAAVKKDGKWGFINKSNETIIPFEYDIPEYSSFLGDYAPAGKNGKFGYIDKTDKMVIPFHYEKTEILYPNAKIFPVKNNGKWGFIDIYENIVIPFEYDNVECNGDGYPYYSVIKKGNSAFETCGLVDPIGGKLIIPCVYKFLCPNQNSICAEIITGNGEKRFGLIDYQSNKITNFIYDKIYDYSNDGLYEAKINGQRGYIDEKGNIVTGFKYLQTERFYGGFALVMNKFGNQVLINSKGEEILTSDQWHDIYNLGAGCALVQNPKTSEYEIVKIKE